MSQDFTKLLIERSRDLKRQAANMRLQSTSLCDEADRLEREAEAMEHGANAIKGGSTGAKIVMQQVIQSQLTDRQRKITECLRNYTSDGIATFSLHALSKDVGMSPPAVRKVINQLWNGGYMKQVGSDSYGNMQFKIMKRAVA